MDAKFISNRLGQIFDNKNDLKKCMIERNGKSCNIMVFNNKISAINCKDALLRPLLRFTLLRTQTDQHLWKQHYQYIPNIDWSKVNNDKDILKLCNCPENKINEYIKYIDNIMNDYPLKEKDS